jgi:multidrug resistance efflux pump
MIAFLTICYASLVWLLFFKLRIAPFNLIAKVAVSAVGIVGIVALLAFMMIYQPYSTHAMIVQRATPIVSEVRGRITDVRVEPNAPVEKGDVLFTIDPREYQATVDGLEAQLAEAIQDAKMLETDVEESVAAVAQARARRDYADIELRKTTEAHGKGAASDIELEAAVATRAEATAALELAEAVERRARLALGSTINGENTTVARLRADLERAKIDLGECTVYAPGDGYMTQIFLEEGVTAVTTVFGSRGTFIYDDVFLFAPFPASTVRYVKSGQPVEVAFDAQPGKIYNGEVVLIVRATGEGTLTPAADLLSSKPPPKAQVGVRIRVTDDVSGVTLPTGTGGSVAIYTDRGKPIRIIRKVIIRMYTWLNYLKPA